MTRGPETEKSHKFRLYSGFYNRFMSGRGLDIGYRGNIRDQAVPVLDSAIGIDLGYPGYDGKVLPFEDESQDYIFSSHMLEHVKDPEDRIRDWFRVIKTGGYLVIMVPHQHLYEKRESLPSRWNAAHKRFYTPSVLLKEVETALPVNSYRVRHLVDNDRDFMYELGPHKHSGGCYEIELVIEKIKQPTWKLKGEEE